jgi:hypothetical protein
MEPRWTAGHIDRSDGFPRPDWDAVHERIEAQVPAEGLHAAFTAAAKEWIEETRAALGGAYRVEESAHFLVLASFPPKQAAGLLQFLEGARRRLLVELLPGLATARGPGKHVAVAFDDVEVYYSYIAHFYPPEGEFPATGGVFLERARGGEGRGYGHFATYGRDVAATERVVAHELTHDCLRHLDVPAWLNEGLATTVESVVMGDGPVLVSREDLDEHRSLWADGTIQDLWSGAAFHRPDETFERAYHLSRMLVRALSHDYGRFREFVLRVGSDDAGEAAARSVYGDGLGGLVARILGPGEWTPQPDSWEEPPADG